MSKITALEVQQAGERALATVTAVTGNWAFDGDASDILIPRLLIGQATSEAVQKEKIAFGQLYRSTTVEAVGGKGKPFAAIPLHRTKTWVISKKKPGGNKFEFSSIEPFTPANKDLPWLWSEEGIEFKREQNLNFFVLLLSDVERDKAARDAFEKDGELPDLEASLLPCVISFKSTSYKEGKKLETHFAKASDFGLPPFVNFFLFDSEFKETDAGRFYVLKLDKGGKTDPAAIPLCRKWYDIVSKSAVKIDEDTHTSAEEFAPAGPQEF